MPEHDLLIVGGGPVGMAAALAVGRECAVAVVEAQPYPLTGADPRPIALSHGSRLILERLGVWDGLAPAATPIARIHVSQRGGFGRVELKASEAGLPALGYVTDYSRLAEALRSALENAADCRLIRASATAIEAGAEAASVHLEAGHAVSARLVVVAEGGALTAATAYTRDYRQSVITTRVASELPHRNVAYERFTPEGPLALLPSGDGLALVWTISSERALELAGLADTAFLHRLQHAFGYRLGTFTQAGSRACYPVVLRVGQRSEQGRVLALGNAAQTLHPVAGQGLNLGLRDAWELAATLRERGREEIGGDAHLRRYRARRRWDRAGGIRFTDTLVRLFSNDIAPLRAARGLGLAALGAAPPVRDFLVRRMTFGARG